MTDHMFDTAPIAHLEIDRDGLVRAANQACAATFGRPVPDVVGRPVASLFAGVVQVLDRRGVTGEEVAFVHGGGSERWGQIFAWPTGEGDHVIVLDITETRRLRLKLENSEAHFRTLGDSAPVLLWIAGRDARCTSFNQRWLEFTGRAMAAEIGDGWVEGVHPEDLQMCMDIYMTAFIERRAFRMEYRLRRADGQFRWVLDTGLPRFSPDGTFAGFIGSCVDVTDFKEANEALFVLKTELEDRVVEARDAISARDEFLSIASHELRTPLTALVLQLSGLQRQLHDTTQTTTGNVAGKVDKAVKATGRLTVLVDSLLDVSRIAAGRLEAQPEACDLTDVARDLTERVGDAARRAGCELRCHFEPSIRGIWDRVRLEQVFDNLLSNAMKYGPGKPIDITVAATDDRATIKVRDHGIGVSTADLDRIFGRFERAVPARHYGGLGLGLYITRQIVEAHDGKIDVVSDPGAGAEFIVELPRWREATTRPSP